MNFGIDREFAASPQQLALRLGAAIVLETMAAVSLAVALVWWGYSLDRAQVIAAFAGPFNALACYIASDLVVWCRANIHADERRTFVPVMNVVADLAKWVGIISSLGALALAATQWT
jgi:hypothetical protein